jgi:hypothetical protein
VLGQKQVKEIFLCVILIFMPPDPDGHVRFCHYLVFLFIRCELFQVLSDTTGPFCILYRDSFFSLTISHI